MDKDTIDLLRDFLIDGLDEKSPHDITNGQLAKTIQTYIREKTEEYRKLHTFPCGACSEPHKVILEDGTEVSVTCLNDEKSVIDKVSITSPKEYAFMSFMDSQGVRFVDMVATEDDELICEYCNEPIDEDMAAEGHGCAEGKKANS